MTGKLSELWLYPVKGLRGHRVASAEVTARGLAGDRRMMLVDDDGRFLTQRSHPKMVQVSALLDGARVVLTLGASSIALDARGESDGAPREVVVWSSTVSALELPEGSRFLTDALEVRCHLVRLPDDVVRPVTSKSGAPGDEVSFADAFPYLLASQSSLDDLRERAQIPLSMERFRPNLVASGLPPWAEDDAAAFVIGGVRFANRKPCDRCSVTTIDPDTALAGKEPLKTLATFRKRDSAVYFGVNLVAEGRGALIVREGDPVTISA